MCFFRFPFYRKAASHRLHLKGFSFVWTQRWSNKFHFLENSLLHPGQLHFNVVLTLHKSQRCEVGNLTFEKSEIAFWQQRIGLFMGDKRNLTSGSLSPPAASGLQWALFLLPDLSLPHLNFRHVRSIHFLAGKFLWGQHYLQALQTKRPVERRWFRQESS